MTDFAKATSVTVEIGSRTVDGFTLPDGSYRMSQKQASECVGKPEINARRFLDSKAIKALLGKDYTPDSIEIEPDANQANQGSPQAQLLKEDGIDPWQLPGSTTAQKQQ